MLFLDRPRPLTIPGSIPIIEKRSLVIHLPAHPPPPHRTAYKPGTESRKRENEPVEVLRATNGDKRI